MFISCLCDTPPKHGISSFKSCIIYSAHCERLLLSIQRGQSLVGGVAEFKSLFDFFVRLDYFKSECAFDSLSEGRGWQLMSVECIVLLLFEIGSVTERLEVLRDKSFVHNFH